ncbi:hypothetical protein [uncultured Duncaniella sp.]|uniref:hypothetical protein n=1 Tax=uncultured Duncaniella sp. TaxID=2768039 RepID=UPI00262CC68D|nr:hypothetical protein [uncultured Duncaniella sp.]
MSKKKNKKKGAGRKVENAAPVITGIFGDDEGETLKPTDEGKQKMAQMRRVHPKLAAGEGAEMVELKPAEEPKPEAVKYDPKPMSDLLDTMEDLVKDGKYKKILSLTNRQTTINNFVVHFAQPTTSYQDEDGDKIYGMCRKLLAIAKSFYEYDSDLQELISNVTYDGLLAKYLASGKPEPVGIVPKGKKNLRKVPITYPTLHNNMDKCYILEDGDTVPTGVKETDSIQAFMTRVYKAIDATPETIIELDLSPKIDGVSINGTIDTNCQLTNPQSRGDHDESVSVIGMNNLQVAVGVQVEEPFGLQYEAFVTDSDREAASNYLGLDRPYVSNRHAASGLIHRLSTVTDDELLKFISLYPIETAELMGTYAERQDFMSNFKIVPADMIPRRRVKGTMNELMAEIRRYFHELEDVREKLDFSIDGMVITIMDDEYQNAIGRVDRTNKWQIAYKFDPAKAEATVTGIFLDNGLKGYRTIQVQLEHPVFIDGVRYDHVPVTTLPAYAKLGLRQGSKVTIGRTGDVIPSITVDVEGNGFKLDPPERCPSCGKKMIIRNQKLFCDNIECESNVVGKFIGFFDRMGMVGYSESFATMLHDTMGCKNLADVLKLTDASFKEKGVGLYLAMGFAVKLKEAIAAHRDYEVVGAMGLPGIGPEKAKVLLEDLDLINNYWRVTSLAVGRSQKLSAACLRAVGPKLAESLESAIRSKEFYQEIITIAPLVEKITEDFSKGTRVGHTGITLSQETLTLCESLGYTVVDGKSFDILITGSMGSTSDKMERAKKMKLPIYTEDDFVKIYRKKAG